ncbi:ATP phosphoribosyltransferase regulatory subunit [Chloroflexota bacterium]
MMRTQRCKGSQDLFSKEMRGFRSITDTFRDCCLKSGYEEVRTPTLEYLHLFTSTGTLTPGMLSKVYSFLDWDGWSGERVVLRPDCTIPVARLYVEGMKDRELAKLCYVANVFSFEATGEETREKWQGGAELIGAGSPLADVELMVLALEVLKKLGLSGIALRLSHAGLIRALITRLGLSSREQSRLFSRILDGDVEALTRLKSGISKVDAALIPLLKLRGESPGLLRNLRALVAYEFPEFRQPLDNFISIVELVEQLGYSYEIDITSGRGFEYYTGIIFQFFVDGEKVGGGGRYDALIPLMGGRETPASGFALYFDYLMKLVKGNNLSKPAAQEVLVRAEPKAIKEGFDVAACLRSAGYIAQLHLGGAEPAKVRWTLDVRNEAPKFVIADRSKNKSVEVNDIADILKVLGGGRCQ